ncbi:MAG: CopD family protein [Anaerolineales bacterium]|jgi:uncharacterized membrane protein
MPTWVLTAAYAIHMLATVVWVGGLAFQAVFLLPATQSRLELPQQMRLMAALRRRFTPLAWLSLALLTATGLTQMVAHPSYQGMLAIGNRWSVAIFAKHLTILLMVGATAYQSLSLHPAYERLLLLQSKVEASALDTSQLDRSGRRLLWINLGLSALVLILTAAARTS